jgi:hypothetical protein
MDQTVLSVLCVNVYFSTISDDYEQNKIPLPIQEITIFFRFQVNFCIIYSRCSING